MDPQTTATPATGASARPLIVLPITKIDAKTRMVYASAATETPDKSGEIFDFDSSVPNFKNWSSTIEKVTTASGQKVSKGNVREMHTPVAAGAVRDIQFDTVLKEIPVAIHVTDDGAWTKCENGTYTGVSIGGSYAKRWKDGEFTRYTAVPTEISLVDNPCNPDASFTMVKADGTTELRKFTGGITTMEQPAAVEPIQVWKCDLHDHAKKDEASSCIRKRAKDPSVAALEKTAAVRAALTSDPLKKCLWGVADMAGAIGTVKWIGEYEEMESAREGDGSPTAADIKAIVQQMFEVLVQMAEECAAEYSAGDEDEGDAMALAVRATMSKAAKDPRLVKALGILGKGKKMDPKTTADPAAAVPATDPAVPAAVVPAVADPAAAVVVPPVVADPAAIKGIAEGDLQKVVGDQLAKVVGEQLTAMTKAFDDRLSKLSANDEAQTEILKMVVGAMPERAKVALRAVSVTKAADGGPAAGEKTENEELAELNKKGDVLGLMKYALRHGETSPEALSRRRG